MQTAGLLFCPAMDSGLKGEILGPKIGQLGRLKEITVAINNFNGSISSEIGKLKHLEILSTDSNRFSGKIPEEITQLGKVRVLALGRNNILQVYFRRVLEICTI